MTAPAPNAATHTAGRSPALAGPSASRSTGSGCGICSVTWVCWAPRFGWRSVSRGGHAVWPAALSITASCLKGFYAPTALGGERGVARRLTAPGCRRGPTVAAGSSATPRRRCRRTARPARPAAASEDAARRREGQTAREQCDRRADRLTVAWLRTGPRIGELCGLHLVDLHLRDDANCGQCRTRTCMSATGRTTRTRAEAKTKHPWRVEDGTVTVGSSSGSARR
jgi:hypothetical protein